MTDGEFLYGLCEIILLLLEFVDVISAYTFVQPVHVKQ